MDDFTTKEKCILLIFEGIFWMSFLSVVGGL